MKHWIQVYILLFLSLFIPLPTIIKRMILIFYLTTIYNWATIIAVCMCLPIYILFVERSPISKFEFYLRTFYRHLVYGDQRYDDCGNKLPPINEPSLPFFALIYLSFWFWHPLAILYLLQWLGQ